MTAQMISDLIRLMYKKSKQFYNEILTQIIK